MRNYINTIQDMENVYYGAGAKIIGKTDAPVISTTTGVYNAVFGLNAWTMLNQEANAFGVLPKYVQKRSGWRVVTARAGTLGTGGVAENGSIPESTKPTFAEVSAKPKTIAHTFNVSEVQSVLAGLPDDDAIGDMQWMRQYFTVQHVEHMNKMLMKDVSTLASNNLESIDRVCSSKGEVDAGLADANDADIHGLDRDGVTTYDAYVSHASGTDRTLTDSIIRTGLYNVRTNGGQTNFILTGDDTYSSIQGLYDPQVRYAPLGQANIKVGVNGVQSKDGIGVGIDVATIYGKPLLTTKDTEKDTISRIYLLDTTDPEGYGEPRLGIRVAKPTQYFEAGMNTSAGPFGINKLADEGMFRTMAELIATALHAQGKIRDLK
jgi:hypothetical protein